MAAAAAAFRLAAGRRKSGSTDSGMVSGAPDAVAAEGSTLLSPSPENPQVSAGGTQSGHSVNSGSGISGQTASVRTVQTSQADGTAAAGTGTAPADGAATAGTGTAPAGGAATAGTGTNPAGTDASSDTSTQAGSAPKKHVVSELETGKAYLDSLDQRSPVEMEYRIDQAREVYEKEQDRKAYLKKRELYRQTLEDDGVWDQFDKYVFLGDSRVVGFNVFGFLPAERVLAEQGDTILAISDRMEAMKELEPSYIFISYGINDIGIGFWQTAGEYADAFSEEIDDLRKEFPDAQIYVNSIIPATDEAVEGVSIWGKIPEYSDALKKMCAEKGIPFIDNTKLIEEHKELYAGDGVHLLAEFYPYWAENQLLGIYDLKNGRNTEGYRLGDKSGQAAGQDSAPGKDKTGASPDQNPAPAKDKTGASPDQNPASN